MNRNELRQAIVVVTAVDGDIFTQVPPNMKRFIYKMKATNLFAGANILTIGARENTVGVATTRVLDRVHFSLFNDNFNDPDELKEDSAPLYMIDGNTTTGMTSFMRGVCSAGTVDLFIEYIDAPA